MRFAFISTMHGAQWGGSEELWSQAAIQLRRKGHDVHAEIRFRPRADKADLLAHHGIRVETYYDRYAGRARRIWNKLSHSTERSYGRLKQFHPDLVIISQGYNAGGFEWAKICREAGIPYALIVHCNCRLWWFDDEEIGDAVASYSGARRVFCVSRNNLDLLRLQVGEPLPNGEVAWNPYNVSPESAPAWPAESEGWRLACVARFDMAAKGHDLLLQTLALPEWRDRPIELNLFGAGLHEVALRRLTELLQLKNVHFRGHVNDIRTIWEQNHMLVLPSRYEGLPLALVEAMWCGRPAVVTDAGGSAELCVDNETGFVASAATLSSFTQVLERAWERREDWPRLGKAARARAEEMIPKDPIALFCDRLQASAAKLAEASAA